VKSPIALRIFLVGTIALFLTIVPTFNKTYASNVIFQDDFENGTSNWTPSSGSSLWTIKNINGNHMYGAHIDSPSTIISTIGGPNINTPNYQIDFDYLPVVNASTSSVDRNLDYRWINNSSTLDAVHFWGETSYIADCNDSVIRAESPTPLANNQINHITIILLNQHNQFFINNTKILDCINTTYQFSGSEKVGMRIGTGDSYPTEAWFDNIVVTSLDINPTPTPSPIPSPTTTPTPTPMPASKLNVPVLRQTDKPWSLETYDGANFWSPLAKTIKSWGCALTSYAMVLKYFGINKLPNGTSLDPGTLNSWLEDNNGYIDGKNSGYINPLAISSLSKKATKINKINSFDALEYIRIGSPDNTLLTNQIKSDHPAVLEEPGHFIVANGISSNTFNIIDPYYTNRNDLTAYNNTFNSLNELIPSKTDLSYIMVTGNNNLDMQIKDSNGNNVGQTFTQQPLVNPETGKQGGDPIKIDYIQKPQSGNYQLALNSNKSGVYDIKLYSYDVDGDVNTENFSIVSNPGKDNAIDLSFNNQNSNKSKFNKAVNFDSLIEDVRNLKSLHLIDTNFADKLIFSISNIQKRYNKKFKLLTDIELNFLNKTLVFYDKRQLSKEAYEIISLDIEDLIKGL